MDITLQWSWLTSGSLMPGVCISSTESGYHYKCFKCNIFHLLLIPLVAFVVDMMKQLTGHVVSGFAQRSYKNRHDEVARMLRYELAKLEGLEVVSQWCNHKPLPSTQYGSAGKFHCCN